MKVLHINQHLGWAGGVETYMLSILPKLQDLGHQQAVVYAKGRGDLVDSSHHVPSLSLGNRRSEKSAYIAINEILDIEKPDIVHLHQVYNLGAVQACIENLPVVVHAHDYRYVCPASTFYYKRSQNVCYRKAGLRCFATTVHKHCLTPRPKFALDYYRRVRWFSEQAGNIAAVVAPSDAAAERYREAGFRVEKIEVLPYFSPIEALDKPRTLPDQPSILFIGRIRPTKGVDTFIRAFAKLPKTVRAVMVGDFTKSMRNQLYSQAGGLGCADRLDMREWVNRDEIRQVYSEATVFAFPSIWPETLGIVGIEALSCGVPVVASDIGGVREWLLPGETGLLAKPKSASDLAQGLRKLLYDKPLNLQFGKNGIDLIRQRFTPEHHIGKILEIYRSCLDEAGPRSAEAVH